MSSESPPVSRTRVSQTLRPGEEVEYDKEVYDEYVTIRRRSFGRTYIKMKETLGVGKNHGGISPKTP